MQKKIIALAVAGLVSGAAFAQSNVTVYGVVDVAYARASATNKTNTHNIAAGQLSSSRLGFKGTEDLGNGMKALFTLEYKLTNDDAFSIGAARQQFVGLNGGFGTVVAGYLQTAGYDFGIASGPVAGSAGMDALMKVGGSVLLTPNDSGRASNAVAYISPSFGGVTIAYNHARLDETSYDNTVAVPAGTAYKNNYANLLGVNFAQGPIAANAVYAKISKPASTLSDDIVEYGVNGSYDFGVAKAFASWQSKDDKSLNDKNKKWGIGAAIPAGPAGTVAVQYAKSKIGETTAKDDVKSWTVAYTHGLSKRTTAYAGYNRVTNEAGGTTASLTAPTVGGKSSTLALGLRHAF